MPRSRSDPTASGPAALNSSRPTLATPNHGRSSGHAVRLDQIVGVERQREPATDRLGRTLLDGLSVHGHLRSALRLP
jgi:hypothetical protein